MLCVFSDKETLLKLFKYTVTTFKLSTENL